VSPRRKGPPASGSSHETLRRYAAGKQGAVVDHPWEDDLVYKVGGKIFVFFGAAHRENPSIMVSCGPDAAEWRERYPSAVAVGPYIGRYGWNTVLLDSEVPDDELLELIDLSYERVVAGLPKSKRPT
jgi:predicted DNA-binding protein (MmcQ/YjbR family)